MRVLISSRIVREYKKKEMGEGNQKGWKHGGITSSPRRDILHEFPGEALGSHLQFLVPRPVDIDDRPARGTDDADAPRRKGDAVRGEVDTGRGEIGAEEVLEARAGLHEVEEVAEGLGLAEVQFRLVRKDVVVHLERDEVVQHRRFAAPV